MSLISFLFGKYEAWVECTNCQARMVIWIPKSFRKDKYLKESQDARCKFCGCRTLVKSIDEPDNKIKSKKNPFWDSYY